MEAPTEIGVRGESSSAALVLLVIGDRRLGAGVLDSVQRRGPLCLWVQSAERIATQLAQLPLRVAVLQAGMLRVWDAASSLTAAGVAVISVGESPEQRLLALDRGCVEALPTDSDPEEIARSVIRVWRKAGDLEGLNGQIRIGPLYMDCSLRRAFWYQEQVHLSPTLFNLLGFLAKHPGEPFTTRELLVKVWADPYKTEGAVWTAVKKLRRALHNGQWHISNLNGYGYRFVAEEPAATMSGGQRGVSGQAS